MAIQYSANVRNARLQAIESALIPTGIPPRLGIWTGTPPSSAGDLATGTNLLDIELPVDLFGAASGGVIAKYGTWSGTAIASGTATYFRLVMGTSPFYAIVQGTVGTSGADLIVESTTIASGQQFSITGFTITAGQD